MGRVTEFVANLRRGIADAQHAVTVAEQAGHPYETHLHLARLKDLLDIASRNDVDACAWLDPAVQRALDENFSQTGA